MKVGVVLTWQNHEADWERYETGEFSKPPAIADWKVYEENRYLGDLVEPLGFDSLFAVEHHMTPHHMTGSALGILTYFAGRTERIDLGTCLIVLPWHHPVRVAEDVCFLDNLLKGRRLWLGIGRGASPREYAGLGIDQGESRDRFAEGVDILRLALTKDCFSYSGKHYNLPQVTVRPRPYTAGLADRLYAGVVTGPSLSITANLGLGLMFVAAGPWDQYAASLRKFNAIRAGHGWQPVNPIVVSMMYCAPTQAQAWEGAKRWIGQYSRTSNKHYLFDQPERFAGVSGYEDYLKTGARLKEIPESVRHEGFANSSLWGTPEQIIEKLQWLADHVHVDHLVALVNPGDMSADDAEASIRLFAKEVIPAARKIQPAAFADGDGAAAGRPGSPPET
jgi:alkanesulfonate monooxygenase SsuD/methylene tetrahydromethanopterin reductase-like flavin-dependent oxidoreductase (luciferase family)